jgi:uncharacterized protein (DUF1330 family)
METRYAIAVAVLTGAAFGIIGMHELDAQSSKAPPAYLVAEQDIIDTTAAQKFQACITPTQVPYHPQLLTRGGKTDSIEGAPPKRIIINMFDSAATARAWVDSPAFTGCNPLRDQAMHERAYIVEGIAPP